MKKTIALFLVLIIAAGVCFAAESVEGYWLSVDDKTGKVTAGWIIYVERGILYGKLLSVADFPQGVLAERCRETYPDFPLSGDVRHMPVVGTPWIYGLTHQKDNTWSGGYVINPEDGRIYYCKITFHAANGKKYATDTLEMRGGIGYGIGRSQFWKKTDRVTASGLRPQ